MREAVELTAVANPLFVDRRFAPVAGLTTAHIGLLWQKYRSRLPLIEEHPPLDPVQRLGVVG